MAVVGNLDAKLGVTLCIFHMAKVDNFLQNTIDPMVIIDVDDQSLPNQGSDVSDYYENF